MYRTPFSVRQRSGAVLILTLGVMVIAMIIGMRFVGVTLSRQAVSNNQKDALRATYIAEAGIQYALYQLELDRGWRSGVSGVSFGGGAYTVTLTDVDAEHVRVDSNATYGTFERSCHYLVTLPQGSGTLTIWATAAGTGDNEWQNATRAYDSADGPNGTFAACDIGKDGKRKMSLAGMSMDPGAAPIVKVEIVLYSQLSRTMPVGNERVYVRWRRPSDGATGPWRSVSCSSLSTSPRYYYFDITATAPPGGWDRQCFSGAVPLEIDVDAYPKPTPSVTLQTDCVGFRISWGTP